MKIKSLVVGLVVSTSMIVATGPIQAACAKQQPGWHMVSKKCPIRSAENWQQYASGVYTQPQAKKMGLMGM